MFETSQKQEQRLKYLAALYKLVDGSPLNTAKHNQIVDLAELNPETAGAIFNYLLNENLLQTLSPSGIVAITHEGVKAYETSILKEKENREKYTATTTITNNLNITGKVAESTIYINNQIEANSLSASFEELKEFTKIFRDNLTTIILNDETKNLLKTQIEELETQLKAVEPKKEIITKLLSNLKRTLTTYALSPGVQFLLTKLENLFKTKKP